MSAAILCRGLTKRFGDTLAVDGIDLEVEEKRVFGFLGPNGAGKTTTIRMLCGLTRPTAGTAYVAGAEVGHRSVESRSRIGYLPENPRFYGWMSGEDSLAFFGRLFGIGGSELRERIDELLRLSGLEEARRRPVSTYSKGMQQRLGIAQALINRPEVIFLDEPCSGLDPVGRVEVLRVIREIGEESTVFMSSHILSDVERVCDEVAILDKGRILVHASIEELRKKYTQPVFRIVFDRRPSRFLSEIEGQAWFSRVEEEAPDSLKIFVRDFESASRQLPVLASRDEATLLSYQVSSPTLEDIFVRLVSS